MVNAVVCVVAVDSLLLLLLGDECGGSLPDEDECGGSLLLLPVGGLPVPVVVGRDVSVCSVWVSVASSVVASADDDTDTEEGATEAVEGDEDDEAVAV